MTQTVLSASQLVQFGGLKGYAGAYLSQANFEQASYAGAESLWESWGGMKSGAARYYGGAALTMTPLLQGMAVSGARICASFNPSVNPPSAADLATLTDTLSQLKGMGADVFVTIWHEPFNNGITAQQYVSAVKFYAPVIRNYYPFWICLLGADFNGGYYPGDQYVDGIATDEYYFPTFNYSSNNITLAALYADNAVPAKALGIWEFNAAPGPNSLTGDSHTFAAGNGNWTGLANVSSYFHSSVVNPFGNGNTGALGFNPVAAGNMAVQSAAPASFATQMTACVPGDIITCASWFQASSVSRLCNVGAQFYTSAGVATGAPVYSTDANSSVNDPVNGWGSAFGTVTAPATAAWCDSACQVQNAQPGETHRISMAYISNTTQTGTSQANVTAFYQFIQSYMTGRQSAGKPNGDVILFNSGMPGGGNAVAVQHSADYRIGLWQAVYAALNDQVYQGSLAEYIGGGSCFIGPTGQGEIWNAGFTVSVHCSSNNLEATCKVYCGDSISPANFTDGTTWGSTGDSTTNTPEVRTGQYVFAVWSGADSQSTGYLNVNGTRTVA